MSVLPRRGDATIVSPGSRAVVSCTKVSAQSDGYQAASVLRPSPNDQSPRGPAAKSGLDPPRQGKAAERNGQASGLTTTRLSYAPGPSCFWSLIYEQYRCIGYRCRSLFALRFDAARRHYN